MRTFILVAGIGLLLGSGYLNSRWTNTRFSPAVLEEAASRFDDLPYEVGDWHGQDGEIAKRILKASGAERILLRHYSNPRIGGKLDVLMVCGRPGPVAAHTPDACYGGAGEEVGDPVDRTIELKEPMAPAPFKMVRVRTGVGTANPGEMEVLWSWVADGCWQTPWSPRLKFARYPYLYKLYIVRTLAEDEAPGSDASVAFLQLLLPKLQRLLNPIE
jgi:hypothetical protein